MPTTNPNAKPFIVYDTYKMEYISSLETYKYSIKYTPDPREALLFYPGNGWDEENPRYIQLEFLHQIKG